MKENIDDNFSELLEESLLSFNKKEGQIVKGTVLFVKNDSVVIDVGLKSEGRIPIREFFSPGEENNIKPGDQFDVLLEKLGDILENIHKWYPLAHTKEYGLSPEYVRLVNIIIALRTASKCMHKVMNLIYDTQSTTT